MEMRGWVAVPWVRTHGYRMAPLRGKVDGRCEAGEAVAKWWGMEFEFEDSGA
jgi:hypothetical protein